MAPYETVPTVRFLDFPNVGQILMEDLAILREEWPPKFNQASDWPEIGGKSTGMEIDEFTDTPSPKLGVTIKVNRDNAAGGYQWYPPPPHLSRVKEILA